eukprot:gi/632966179/ref/XP_007899275.1/ PREDICTED: E3 SUMO-protein ligase PIAS4 isoform X3 [Callorhinchus milii]
MAEQRAAKNMILGFRVSELQVLLGFAGRNKSGLKHELVSRALQLVRTNWTPEVFEKIQELHVIRHSSRTMNTSYHQVVTAPTFPLHSSEAALNARTSVTICHTGKDDAKSRLRLTNLPFYEILDEVMKPTNLVPSNNERIQENQFGFTLTEKHRQQIICGFSKSGGQAVQVQLRICHTDTEFIQEDQYPPYLTVLANSRLCPFTRYSVVLYLVRQQTTAELIHKLQVNETRSSEVSGELIRKKLRLEPENDITTTGLRVSLMCSLGKMRLSVPCRGITCTHLQCFDAALYIQMNEKKPTWMCPVCDKPAPYELLFVDQLFLDILEKCQDSTEVQFKDDGSWSSTKPEKQLQRNCSLKYSIVELEDSDSILPNPVNYKGDVDIIDLTVDC